MVDYLKKIKKRFFGFLKEFLTEMSDEIKLVLFDQRIKGLNEDIEFDKFLRLEPDIDKELDLDRSCLAYNNVLKRINAREEKSSEGKVAQLA